MCSPTSTSASGRQFSWPIACGECLTATACTPSAPPGRRTAPLRAGICGGASISRRRPARRGKRRNGSMPCRGRSRVPHAALDRLARRLVPAANAPRPPIELFAICAPGLERLAARELESLSLTPHDITPGGVSFRGDVEAVWRANLWLRTASRVVVRLGSFRARALGELERRARDLPWDTVLPARCAVRVRATAHKSRLYHTAAIAERVAASITARVPGATFAGAADAAHALVIVRVAHDTCLLSADSSGDLLHRRGYRFQTAKAPMRETLAAAMLLASEWDGRAPLVDPFCGSGTIPIEAALIARRIPPGARRRFAFE